MSAAATTIANDRVSITLGEDGVADVRLVRADKMNALDPEMFQRIIEAGQALHKMKGLRAVVLSGEGRAFCAGLDLSNFSRKPPEDEPPLTERTYGNANRPQQVAMQWRKLPVPVIAAVHGVCFGGGLQIASGADIRIVHPETRMAIMELKWGLVPDMGGYVLWRGLVRDDVLRELIYTNREFTGAEALSLGLATHLDQNPRERALAIAREIALKNPHAIRGAKRLQAGMFDRQADSILMDESIEQHGIMRTRNQIEAVMAEMERRKPNFEDV
jgi:enoyl-CoA hydratase/carnithine racemase